MHLLLYDIYNKFDFSLERNQHEYERLHLKVNLSYERKKQHLYFCVLTVKLEEVITCTFVDILIILCIKFFIVLFSITTFFKLFYLSI